MARESKKKREERRFGKPERLADMVALSLAEDWTPPKSFVHADEEHRRNYCLNIAGIISEVQSVPIFDFTNVSEYVYKHEGNPVKFQWDAITIRPPFDFMFIESSAPPIIADHRGPKKFGFLVQHGPSDVMSRHWENEIQLDKYNTLKATTGLVLTPVWLAPASGRQVLCFPGYSVHFFLDADGTPTDRPIVSIDKWHHVGKTADAYKLLADILLFSAISSLMFLNCRNVVTLPVEPDPQLNRERLKAKLKPFVRYHTINIEPMRKVLRAEGCVETNGLKKALHICKGYFRRYTEEKPLFGHYVGTVWTPSHVRGSAKEGVVVSDYRVNAPKGATR